MKKFMKKTEGFTLVELIVVIAILGILAGVGTVGYSGYIKKANMAADQQLVAGVKNALMLAGIQGDLKSGSAVVLTQSDVILQEVNDDSGAYEKVTTGAIDEALKAAYGEGYADTMKLKYDGWTGVVGGNNIASIEGSSFSEKNLSSLLESVNGLTSVLGDFLGDGILSINTLNNYAEANGIDPTTADSQTLANMMPMMIAENLTVKMAGTVDISGTATSAQDVFVQEYTNMANFMAGPTGNGGLLADKMKDGVLGLDKYTAYSVEYAQVEGLLNYLVNNADTDAEKTEANTLLSNWKAGTATLKTNYSGNPVSDIETLLDNTKGAIATSSMATSVIDYFDNGAAEQDAKAFLGYMEGFDETTGSLLENPESLKSSTYYQDETVSNLVTSYITAAKVAQVMGSDTGSMIIISYAGEDLVTCYPDM